MASVRCAERQADWASHALPRERPDHCIQCGRKAIAVGRILCRIEFQRYRAAELAPIPAEPINSYCGCKRAPAAILAATANRIIWTNPPGASPKSIGGVGSDRGPSRFHDHCGRRPSGMGAAEVDELEESKQWVTVIGLLGRLIQGETDRVKLVDLYCRRGNANGGLGQLEPAANDYKKARELGDTDKGHRYGEYAHLLAALGKRVELEQLCLEALGDPDVVPAVMADLISLAPITRSVREQLNKLIDKKKDPIPRKAPTPIPGINAGRCCIDSVHSPRRPSA